MFPFSVDCRKIWKEVAVEVNGYSPEHRAPKVLVEEKLASKQVNEAEGQDQPHEHLEGVLNMLRRFLVHSIKGKSRFDSAVDVLEGVQDQAVERFVEPSENIANPCKQVLESGF